MSDIAKWTGVALASLFAVGGLGRFFYTSQKAAAEREELENQQRLIRRQEREEMIAREKAIMESIDPLVGEVQVFRDTPEVGKCYFYAEATRTFYKNEISYAFTTNKLTYVGKFIGQSSSGWGDGKQTFAYFERNNQQIKISYSYEGNTSFLETTCRTYTADPTNAS